MTYHKSLDGLLVFMDNSIYGTYLAYDWSIPIIGARNSDFIRSILFSDVDLMIDGINLTNPLAKEDLEYMMKCSFGSKKIINRADKRFSRSELRPLNSPILYDEKSWTKNDTNVVDSKIFFNKNIDNVVDLVNSACDDGNVLNLHKLIIEKFELSGDCQYSFIKTIRDNNGYILKIDTISPPVNENGIIEYSPGWIKKYVCYPRYKRDMKLHIIKGKADFTIYNDYKMLIWEIKSKIKQLGLDLEYLSTEQVKEYLFNSKTVYVKYHN